MIPNAVEPLSETLAVTIFRNSRPSDVRSAARHENSHQDKEGDPPHNEETHSVPFAKIGKLLFSNVLPTQQSPMPRHESLLYHDIQRSIYSLTPSAPDPAHVRRLTEFQAIEREHDVEIIIDRIPADPSTKTSSRPIKLALFDMDSTLINEEVIDELARSIGKTDIVSAITARAMNGELDFETSLRERVAMLRGVRSDVWEELKRRVTIAEGARELDRGLKENGAVVTGVVSGGFMPMAEWLKGELGLDHALANHVRGNCSLVYFIQCIRIQCEGGERARGSVDISMLPRA